MVKDKKSPEIGLIITPDGVRGAVVLGDTLQIRQKSLALLDTLEPDLIRVKRLLDRRIESLKKSQLERFRAEGMEG